MHRHAIENLSPLVVQPWGVGHGPTLFAGLSKSVDLKLEGRDLRMSEKNKAILQQANAAVAKGDYEGFLSHCTEDVEWTFVGEQTLKGKEAVRQYMKETYIEPPKFAVDHLIAEGDFVTALGDITLKDEKGREVDFAYCDVWRIRGSKLAELRAFVVEMKRPHSA